MPLQIPLSSFQCVPYTAAKLRFLSKLDHVVPFLSRSLCSILSSLSSFDQGFPESLVGEESTCNAGDSGLIPGLGRSTGEGIGYPFQSSWASLVAQLVKNPPAVRVTWVRLLGWEDPLEKGKATHSSILAWRIPWTM